MHFTTTGYASAIILTAGIAVIAISPRLADASRRPAAFLDRDGTLVHDPGFLHDPAQVRLLPGAAAAVASQRMARARSSSSPRSS